MAAKDGMFYAAKGKPDPVVKPGEFVFSAVGLDHGHIYGMTSGLLDAGATLKYVYDPDPQKVEAYRKAYPQAIAAESEEQVLADPETKLVAGACVTSERAALGIRVMQAGKDYFTDKAPLTTLEQLEDVKRTIAETGRKYMVNYSERLQVEAAVYAGELVQAGAIGKVVQVIGMGPHRLNAPSRPAWFFEKEKYGGILCDIGSHQIGLSTWGDGRTFILGTDGYIELRKYVDLARSTEENHVFWADKEGEHYFNATGKTGFPFFGQLVLDCIHRTENAMTQEHALKAAELCVRAQLQAEDLSHRG